MSEKRYSIEASDHEHDWDSDYVGTESYTLDDARKYMRELEDDDDWDGWYFRLLRCDDDGCYRVYIDKETDR